MNPFGPNTTLVSALISRIQDFPWFTRIEQPHPQDNSISRVPVSWLLDRPLRPWQGALAAHETPIERLILDNGLLEFQIALDQYYKPSFGSALDDLLFDLDERFSDHYAATHRYPHELLDLAPVERIIRFSLYECLVDDLPPRHTFFRSLLDWFADGYWPCGWSAEYPDGHLIVL